MEFEELVPCVCKVCRETDDKQLYKLSVLENALIKGKKEIECQTSFVSVNVRKLLEGIYIEDKEKGNKEMSNTFNIGNIGQLINQPQDNVSITQNIYKNAPELKQKLDEMFDKINEKQSAEMNGLIDILFQKIDESRLKAKQFSGEAIKEFKKRNIAVIQRRR